MPFRRGPAGLRRPGRLDVFERARRQHLAIGHAREAGHVEDRQHEGEGAELVVDDLEGERAGGRLVRDLLGADVVAEGVEDKSQLQTLKTLDCHRAQGYLISPPVDVHDVPRVVRSIEDPDSWVSTTI